MKNTKNYSVYFEIYGKKMKASIMAESMTEAQAQVKDKIIFHKTIVDKDDFFNKSVDTLNSIMDIFDGKK